MDPAADRPVVEPPLAHKVEEPGATNRTGPSMFLHKLFFHKLSAGTRADDYDLRYSPRDARPRVLMGATSFQADETEAKELIP